MYLAAVQYLQIHVGYQGATLIMKDETSVRKVVQSHEKPPSATTPRHSTRRIRRHGPKTITPEHLYGIIIRSVAESDQ